jgi:hypothetical protein
VHRQLNKLVGQGEIEKVGKPPLVFYVLAQQVRKATQIAQAPILPASTAVYIDNNYLYISPRGEIVYGMDGLQSWVTATKQDTRIVPLSEEYIQMHRAAEASRSPEGWIDAIHKVTTTFPDNALTKLLYGGFYSIQKFGKTKLGNLVLYAKQSQNRQLIDSAVEQVKLVIERIMTTYTIAFAPSNPHRKLQFMQEFADKLGINLPKVKLVKSYRGDVIVP